MKKIFFATVLIPLFSIAYYAEIRPLDKPKGSVLYRLDLSESKKDNVTEVLAQFKTGDKVEMEEKARVNETTAEFTRYEITQNQTKEKGLIEVIEKQAA